MRKHMVGDADEGMAILRAMQSAVTNAQERDERGRFLPVGEHTEGSNGDLTLEDINLLDELDLHEPGVFYTGTHAGLESEIVEHGLKTPKSRGLEMSDDPGISERIREHGHTSVYLSKSPSYANTYAHMAAESNGAEPMLLRVTVPPEHRGKLKRDEEPTTVHSKRYEGDISPEWIERMPHFDEGTGEQVKVTRNVEERKRDERGRFMSEYRPAVSLLKEHLKAAKQLGHVTGGGQMIHPEDAKAIVRAVKRGERAEQPSGEKGDDVFYQSKLTASEHRVVGLFTSSDTFSRDVNASLRDNLVQPHSREAGLIEVLDKVIKKAGSFASEKTLYRGIGHSSDRDIDKTMSQMQESLKTGKPIVMPEYVAATPSAEKATEWVGSKQYTSKPGIVLEIEATHGAYVGNLNPKKEYQEYEEHILPRGRFYEVKAISTKIIKGEPRQVVSLRQLSPEASKGPVSKQDRQQVRDAFDKLDRKRENLVTVADLREALPHLSRERFDAVVRDMRERNVLSGTGVEGRQEPAERKRLLDAGIVDGDRVLTHLLVRNTVDSDGWAG